MNIYKINYALFFSLLLFIFSCNAEKINNDILENNEFQFKIILDSVEYFSWDDAVIKIPTTEKIEILHDTNEIFPYEFPIGANLKELYIYSCNYEHLPTSVGNLTNLEKLILDYTFLEEFPESFKELNNLKQLRVNKHDCYGVSSCRFLIGDWIQGLEELEKLVFVDCEIKELDDNFSKLISLEEIVFKHSDFEEFPRVLVELDNLKKILIINSKGLEVPELLKNKKNVIIRGTFQ